MNNYTLTKYQTEDYEVWNAFISKCKNATFLFHRDFMEYHNDRFEDFSLLIFEQSKLVAVLPANRVGNSVYSHQGLTYGGLVFSNRLKNEKLAALLDSLLDFLKNSEISAFYYHPILSFYLDRGNETLPFLLMKKGGQLYRKEMNMVVNLTLEHQISKSKLKHFKKCEKLGLQIREESSFKPFWEQVLVPRLQQKYQAKPVHNLEEITFLHSKFPQQIKQYCVYQDGVLVAGITIFEFEKGVKSQYGATTDLGQKYRALDFIFISLQKKYQLQGKKFFDMGLANDSNEKGFHSGLLQQKEELGCSVYSQDFYKITL